MSTAVDAFLHPQLSLEVKALVRALYGFLLLMTLIGAGQHARRFFVSERWGGYGQSCPAVDCLQNRWLFPVVFCLWFGTAVCLIVGFRTLWAAAINALLCHYYFVQMRWKGVLRGMGAPGFMTWWLGAVVFLLELTSRYAPDLRSTALLVAQVDFAGIMLSAGIYKFTAGYRQNHGMELGMANPQWGFWHAFYRRFSPSSRLFKTLNQCAWSTEVMAGAMMLVPATRFLGGVLIVGSFLFIATQIRLGTLCFVVMVAGLLFFAPDTMGGRVIDTCWPANWPTSIDRVEPGSLVPWAHTLLAVGLWGYLVLLPPAHAGLFYNFYGHRSLPRRLQLALERYTNFFGIIIWRVFSADHTTFCIMVHRQQRIGAGQRVLISDYGRLGGRFRHVGESITLTTLFTTLKYYPSNSALFRERLLRYARTLDCPRDQVLVFEYLSVVKQPGCFELVPIAEYHVDVPAGDVDEVSLSAELSTRQVLSVSPVREGVRPGSYVAART